MVSRISGALIAALMLLPASGTGQSTRTQGVPTRVPATIALVEQLPASGAPFVLLRRPAGAQHDVILLTDAADADLLSEAVQMLLVARQAGGDTATTAAMLRVRPQQGRATPRRVFPWAQRVLSDLRRASPRPIEGVGTVAAVEIWFPPQSRRVRN